MTRTRPDLGPAQDGAPGLDADACYRAVSARDRRFDGLFWTGVRSTGIYCRPSCPARTPGRAHVSFHASAAAAQSAGFRACKRCLPDATPGSPQWDVAAGAAARAVRLIADGVVDREGVEGLARRTGYTTRHLTRLLTQELGAGPLALARARRAQAARVLLERSGLTLSEVAFAAGFASVRQFNDTVREVYDATPTALRERRARADAGRDGPGLTMRIPVRTPFAGRALLDFLAYHVVAGVETAGAGWYARTLDLPHGPGTVRISLDDDLEPGGVALVEARFTLSDVRDTLTAVERVRRLLDADADLLAVADDLGSDPVLGPLVALRPGLRVPGQVDGDETAVRTVVGQQVSVTGARTVTARMVAEHGTPLETGIAGLTHLFPRAGVLAAVDPETLPMPRARGRALVGLCAAIEGGDVVLDRGAPRQEVRAAMVALRGIGPWTADYVAMRALGHPDVFLPTDLGVRNALRDLGHDPVAVLAPGGPVEGWSPWRSYALMHLWAHVVPPSGTEPKEHR